MKPSPIALWIGVLTGPLVLAAEQEANFALVFWACQNDAQWVLRLIDLIALFIVLGAAAVAWSSWQRVGQTEPDDSGGWTASARFLALGGLLLSLMFAMAIVWHGVQMFILGVCQ